MKATAITASLSDQKERIELQEKRTQLSHWIVFLLVIGDLGAVCLSLAGGFGSRFFSSLRHIGTPGVPVAINSYWGQFFLAAGLAGGAIW